MDDPFPDDRFQSVPLTAPQEFLDEPMSRSTESNSPTLTPKMPRSEDRGSGRSLQETLAAKHICPFCGSQNPAPAAGAAAGPCPRCTMEDTAATRQATKARIGPWHVLQTRNPAAPGMRYATLLALIGKGQVTGRSIVRGPTTHQLWRWAGHVRGLSREFGVCYSCGQPVERTASHCPNCDRSQEPQGNPDALLETRESVKESRAGNGSAGGYADGGNSLGMLSIAGEESPSDPYAVRSPALTAGTHAERLRNNGDYRPVDSRIDVRTDAAGANRRRDGRILSSMELAAALQVAPATPPVTQGHPVRTALMTIVIVGGLAAIIIAYARPDLRRQSIDWMQTTWQPIQTKLSGFTLQKPPPTPNADGDTASADTSTPPAETTPSTVAPAPDRLSQSSSSRANTNVPPAMTLPTTPAAIPTVTPAPAVVPVTPSVAPATPLPDNTGDNFASTDAQEHPSLMREKAKLSPPSNGAGLSTKDIWALRNRALDAESREDWATEIKIFLEIETAPKELWPADTKIRLANARRAQAAQ